MAELMKCPFCGSDAHSTYSTHEPPHYLRLDYVFCKNTHDCNARVGPFYGGEADAIAAWNRVMPRFKAAGETE